MGAYLRGAALRSVVMSELQEAIEHLYETFRPYRASSVAGGPCCVSAEEQARLHTKRLRQLSGDDLGSYAFSAPNTWGTLTIRSTSCLGSWS